MQEPNISWYIIEDKEEIPTDDHYIGNYKYGDLININLRIWNNRWGENDIQKAKDIVLEISFLHLEESIMFNNMKLFEEGIELDGFQDGNVLKFRLNKDLSGEKHSINEYENNKNHVDLNLQILVEDGIRRSIKNMMININYDRSDS